jgi:hypothetical protein
MKVARVFEWALEHHTLARKKDMFIGTLPVITHLSYNSVIISNPDNMSPLTIIHDSTLSDGLSTSSLLYHSREKYGDLLAENGTETKAKVNLEMRSKVPQISCLETYLFSGTRDPNLKYLKRMHFGTQLGLQSVLSLLLSDPSWTPDRIEISTSGNVLCRGPEVSGQVNLDNWSGPKVQYRFSPSITKCLSAPAILGYVLPSIGVALDAVCSNMDIFEVRLAECI